MSVELTDEQEHALAAFDEALRKRSRRCTLGGYAGTGKTTVIAAAVERFARHGIGVCTPTGKAAHVLRSKGVEAATLHSLIYRPKGRAKSGDLEFTQDYRRDVPRVVIVDEASMLTRQLVADLERRVNVVLYVGDHGQLEPVGDDPGLMRKPDVRLETIHRQAENSPIIVFAHNVRRGYDPRTFGHDARVQVGWSEDLVDFDVVLVGFNTTRVKVNAWMRKHKGFTASLPEVGETVICLRNDADWQVWNGMLGTVTRVDTKTHRFDVTTDDGPRCNVPFEPAQFGVERTLDKPTCYGQTLWDWGYALTVHKSQGSEFARVAVVEEIAPRWSAERWRYTAATRASQQLRWVMKER